MITKVCNRCGRELDVSCFGISNKNKGGRQHWCRECHSDYAKTGKTRHSIRRTKAPYRNPRTTMLERLAGWANTLPLSDLRAIVDTSEGASRREGRRRTLLMACKEKGIPDELFNNLLYSHVNNDTVINCLKLVLDKKTPIMDEPKIIKIEFPRKVLKPCNDLEQIQANTLKEIEEIERTLQETLSLFIRLSNKGKGVQVV